MMRRPLLTDDAFLRLQQRVARSRAGASLMRSECAAGTRLFLRQEKPDARATVSEIRTLDDLDAVVGGAAP